MKGRYEAAEKSNEKDYHDDPYIERIPSREDQIGFQVQNPLSFTEEPRFHVENPVRSEELLTEIEQIFDGNIDDTRNSRVNDLNLNPNANPIHRKSDTPDYERDYDLNEQIAKSSLKSGSPGVTEMRRKFARYSNDEFARSETEESDTTEAQFHSDWRKFWLSKLKSKKGT